MHCPDQKILKFLCFREAKVDSIKFAIFPGMVQRFSLVKLSGNYSFKMHNAAKHEKYFFSDAA